MKKALFGIGSIGVTALALPAIVLAGGEPSGGSLGNLQTLVQSFGQLVNSLIPIVFAIILLVFFWGLARYVLNADNEEAKDQGKRIMIGGIIALFVAAAIWGIIGFLENALLGGESAGTRAAPGVGAEADASGCTFIEFISGQC